ncbi:MAG TPA: multifunctional CCA addition/repair protein [Porticoccaceae bacterium]|nr:multifunctional CCA addition/repair protein [Porticoccaceae bacterium]HIK79413.1 multifunctional CCA addition/repair protein [Porticoccaceae bacterium]
MKIYRVGGAVRDKLLNYPCNENDWVVVGSSPEEMIKLGYQPVGNYFPVFIKTETGEEYALARTERKSGVGYQGFTFHTTPNISLEDDLIRRDLTINAMAEDADGNIIDPYGGRKDLNRKVLRHVSDAFIEDPLRILRVARFAARYHHLGFTIAPETEALMKSIVNRGELAHLVAERVWKETDRALCEQSPDLFIQTLRNCGALAALLPEVNNLFGVAQRADYHPEIDTGVHTLMALQQAAILSDKPAIRFAVLVHDLGKGITPSHILPSHSGHEARGLPLVKAVCDRLKAPNEHRQLAMIVTEFHLLCHKALELRPTTLLTLLKTVGAIKSPTKLEDFLTCCTADAKGRTGFESREYVSAPYLRAAAKALQGLDISDIVNSGVNGAEIGKQLALRQTDALQQLKDTYHR